jgi:hypothetical protein
MSISMSVPSRSCTLHGTISTVRADHGVLGVVIGLRYFSDQATSSVPSLNRRMGFVSLKPVMRCQLRKKSERDEIFHRKDCQSPLVSNVLSHYPEVKHTRHTVNTIFFHAPLNGWSGLPKPINFKLCVIYIYITAAR